MANDNYEYLFVPDKQLAMSSMVNVIISHGKVCKQTMNMINTTLDDAIVNENCIVFLFHSRSRL